MNYSGIIKQLRSKANPRNVAGMARYGIKPTKAFGVSIPDLRAIAGKTGKDHRLALELWRLGYHEARILAGMVDDPDKVTSKQMDSWASEFDSWDICDGTCSNLFRWTPYAYQKAFKWTKSGREYVKRAGYVMMAVLASGDKEPPDAKFRRFMPVIVKGSTDGRNFVKKAVNWALRQIGKRNRGLKVVAIKTANGILKIDSKAARWIASDALRELRRI